MLHLLTPKSYYPSGKTSPRLRCRAAGRLSPEPPSAAFQKFYELPKSVPSKKK